jgi:hypothetical protein
MKRNLFALFFLLVCCADISAQEKLVDLRENAVLQTKQAELRLKHHTTRADTIPFSNPYNIINLPFSDDFKKPGPYPDSALWINNEVFVNRTYPVAPMNYGVATFDGLDKNGYPYDITAQPTTSISCDTMTSKRINLNLGITPGSADTVYMSFYYQAQGRGNAPEPEDSLFLEFHSSADTIWREVWSHIGYSIAGSKDTGFHQVLIPINTLDTGKYINTPWFQFRFRNFATPCGNLDHWNLDCVSLKQFGIYSDTILHGLALVYEPLSFLANYQSMPWRQYQGTSDMASNARVYIRNNEAAGTRPVTYEYQGSHYGNPFSANYVGNDPIGPLPFYTAGYESLPAIATPPVSGNGFSFGNALSDTTVFTINHINHVNITSTETLSVKQNFFNYYAYDDGTAEIAYGLEGLGTGNGASLCVQFKTNISDTLKAVQFFWSPTVKDVSSDGFKLCVWDAGSGTGPGKLIYRSDSMFSPQYMHGYNHFRTYYLHPPLILPAGTFYTGWRQYTEDNLSVGFDQNTNAMSHNFFCIDSMSNWQASIFPGSLMIRPLFGDTIRMNGIADYSRLLAGVNLYPNPANEQVFLSIPYQTDQTEFFSIQIMDMCGKELDSRLYHPGEALDVSFLPNGFYFIRITSRNKASCVKKLLISR